MDGTVWIFILNAYHLFLRFLWERFSQFEIAVNDDAQRPRPLIERGLGQHFIERGGQLVCAIN